MAEKNKRRTSDNIPDICPEGHNAIKLIENALKEARQGAFRVRNCHDFEKMCMPNRRRGTPPEKL